MDAEDGLNLKVTPLARFQAIAGAMRKLSMTSNELSVSVAKLS
jgi:hypothetical protein